MTGKLGLFSLVDLFQLLAAASRTGRLTVDHPLGPARVFFDKGRVVHAEHGDRIGEEAVYGLFMDERGSFEFTMGLTAPDVSIEAGTENLVLEAIRRLDEARRDASGTTISSDSVPAFTDKEPDRAGLVLAQEEHGVLDLVDGYRSVAQIAVMIGREFGHVREVIDRLIRSGVLQLKGRRARTARLVARLADQSVASGAAGVDAAILGSWERSFGYAPDMVACKRPDGRVLAFTVFPMEGAGPFIHFTRDTLVRANLAVEETLLVRPVPRA